MKSLIGKKRLFKIAAVLIAAAVIAVMLVIPQSAEARVSAAEKGNIEEYIELRGIVMLDKKETVYSKLAGTVKAISLKEGDKVSAGDELAQLDVQDLDLALGRAQSAYDAAKAALEDLRKSIKPERVKQAEAAADQALAQVRIAEADYGLKKDRLEKINGLLRNGSISVEEQKDAATAVTAAEGTLAGARRAYDIARNELEIVRKGVSGDAIKAAEANAEQARLSVEELWNNMGRTRVCSGMDGVVLERRVENGEFVQPGSPLYEIGDYASAYIKVDVLSDDAAKIRPGQKAVLSGGALDDRKLPAEVYYIAPRAESKVSSLGVEQQRVEVRLRFENPGLVLKPGYGIDADIISDAKQSVVYVPYKSVFTRNKQDQVFVLNEGRLEVRNVRTGIENDDYIEIIEGLKEGDRVVVDPGNSLKPGMRIKESK